VLLPWLKKIENPIVLFGLDIGSAAIKLVHMQRQEDVYRIKGYGISSLPPHAIIDDEICDPSAVKEAILSSINQIKTPVHKAVIALSDNRVMSKTVRIKRSDDLEATVLLMAE
jgi:Tfp pilus assembly PilM family ATPase